MNRSRRPIWLPILAVVAAFLLGAGCGPPAPNVTVTTPAHGEFVDAGSVAVQGTVNLGSASGAVLTVNGTTVAVQPDKSWSTTVSLGALLNPIEVIYTRGAREDRERFVVIAGQSVADGALSPESVALRVNDGGFDRLESTITSLVNVDLSTLIPDGLFIGSVSGYNIFVTTPEPSFSDPLLLDIDTVSGAADVAIDLNGLRVHLFMDGFGAFDCSATIDTNGPMELDASFALEPQALAPTLMDVTQVGPVTYGDTDFVLDITSGICVVAEAFGAIPDVDQTVRDALSGFLDTLDGNGNTPLAAAIEGALAGIQISGPVGQGLGLQFMSPMSTVAEDDDGLTIGADSRFVSQDGTGPGQCAVPPGAPDFSASYHVDEPLPLLGPLSPGGLPYQLGIGISSSAFSQLLKASTECGLLAVDLTEIDIGVGPMPITPALLSLFAPEFGTLDPATVLNIQVRPTLAPIVSGATGPAGELAELAIGQLRVDVIADPGGENQVLLGVAADALVGLDLALIDGGLAPTVAEPDPSGIDVFVLDNTIGANTAAVEALLPFVLAPLVPSLTGALASFPLPEFFGFQLETVEVGRADDFMALYVDLADAPPAGTVITHDAFTVNNGAPPSDYGDNVSASGGNYVVYTDDGVTGTPNVTVSFAGTGNAKKETWANWGLEQVLQLEDTGATDNNDFLFNPESGWAVEILGFDLDKWSGGGNPFWVDWSVSGPISGTLASGTWNLNQGGGRSTVTPGGALGQSGEPLTLRFRHIYGDGAFLAIDNLHFKQVLAPCTPPGATAYPIEIYNAVTGNHIGTSPATLSGGPLDGLNADLNLVGYANHGATHLGAYDNGGSIELYNLLTGGYLSVTRAGPLSGGSLAGQAPAAPTTGTLVDYANNTVAHSEVYDVAGVLTEYVNEGFISTYAATLSGGPLAGQSTAAPTGGTLLGYANDLAANIVAYDVGGTIVRYDASTGAYVATYAGTLNGGVLEGLSAGAPAGYQAVGVGKQQGDLVIAYAVPAGSGACPAP